MVDRTSAPRLAALTWPEIAAWVRRDPRLIIPVGACVQHGPHLPLGTDLVITTAVAEGIGARYRVLVAPPFTYGSASETDQAYAGTAALRSKTLHRALNDLVSTWEAQGVMEFVLLTSNGFGPHYRALVSVMSEHARIRAVDINVVDLSPVLFKPMSPERAGEAETSLMLYLEPDQVRLNVREDLEVDPDRLDSLIDGSEPTPLPGSSGVIGRPTAATAEKGKRIYEYLVRYIGERMFEQDAAEEAI